MDIKTLFCTFGIVFLAELGDKTQLTALALTSNKPNAGLSVFLGSSIALICTSALAVLCGTILTRYIPAKYINLASAILFIVLGCIMLASFVVGIKEKATI
ncbi:MAG: TMEM165/GDT1 family protein [Lentisphaeria bacterium]